MRKKILTLSITFLLLLFGVFALTNNHVKANEGNIEVSIFATLDGKNQDVTLHSGNVQYGVVLNVDASTAEGTFVFWLVDGVVDLEKPANTTFIATNNLEAVAVFKKSGTTLNVYIDHSGRLIKANYGENIAPANPDKIGYNFANWQTDVVNGVTIHKATYTLTGAQVRINGQEEAYNSIVTLTAESGEAWFDGDVRVSLDNELKLSALDKRTLEARVANPITSLVTLRELEEFRTGHKTYIAQVFGNVVEYGLELDGVLTKATNLHPETNEFIISIPTTKNYNTVRAYAIFNNGTELITVYSENNFIFEEVLPSILEVRQEEVNSNVKFKGIVTGFTDYVTQYSNYDKVFLEDGTASIVVYRAEFPEDLEIGDEFIVEGSVAVHRGLIQIAQGATVTLNSKGNELQTPTTITDLDDITIDLQAQRVSFEGTIKSISSTGQIMVVDLDGKEITIRSNSSSNSDPVNEHILTGNVDQKVRIIGMNVDWYDGKQLLPIMVSQIELLEPTDAEKIEQIELLLSEYNEQTYDMGTDVPFITTDPLYNVAIAWTYDKEELVVDGKFVTPNNKDEQVTATATFTVGETVATYDIIFTVKYLETGSFIEQLIYETGFESSEGFEGSTTYNNEEPMNFGPANYQWSIVSGTVSTTSPLSGSQSVQTRDYTNMSVIPAITSLFALTDVTKIVFKASNTNDVFVRVSYSLNGTDWLGEKSFTLSSTSTEYTFSLNQGNAIDGNIYIRFLADNNNTDNDKERMYIDDVKVYGMVEFNPLEQDVEAIEFEKYDDIVNDLVLPELGAINGSTISWSSSNEAVISENGVLTLPELTETVILTATATDGTNTYEKEFAFTVTGVRTRIEALLELINLPIQTDENLVLPEVTEDNDSITWTSSNTAVITNEGVVTRPTDENAIVTLTATIVEAGYTMTKTFEVEVVAEGSAVVTQVTMEFGDNKFTGNGSSQNGQKTIDGLGFTVTSSTAYWDGNSSNSLRLGSSKNTGSITLTFGESIKITKVTVYASQYDGAVSVKVNELGAQVVSNSTGSDYIGYEFSLNELSEFTVSSVNTTKSRMQIQKIVIEYSSN